MAANKIIRIGPVALTPTMTTNVINTAITSLSGPVGYVQTQPYLVLSHVRIINKTNTAATFSLWVGASGANAAGTEAIGSAVSVAAYSYFDWYGRLRLDSTDYLVGGASASNALTIEAEAEIGLA